MWGTGLSTPHLPTCLVRRRLQPFHGNSCSVPKSMNQSMTTLAEADVGIFCYVSQLPGFCGILKQRYSDFIVNEVDLDGNVIHLTSFVVPPEKSEETEQENLASVPEDFCGKLESFKSLAGEADAESLKALLDQIQTGAERSIPPIVLSPDPDKSHRTDVHNFFKSNFKFLITDTVDGPDACLKCVRVRYSCGVERGRGPNSRKRKDRESAVNGKDAVSFDSRGSSDWADGVGKYLQFHLYKENKDTQEALGLIGKMLGIQQRSFGFAGTKDKRSISTQRVTVFKRQAKRLAALNDRLFGIKVGNFCYVHEQLVLGQLLGNRFTIILRRIASDSDDTIKEAAEGLGKNGFINYFGLQRFGSGSVPTYLVGAALLRGEWKAAASLLLDPREGERTAIREAREYYKETGDIDGTLRRLPRYLVAERSILQCLKKCPGNYLQALKAIPRTLRMMYVHSYQSYLWNHAASIRVQKYGIGKVVVGDLVCRKEASSEKIADAVNGEAEDDCFDENDSNCLAEASEAISKEKEHDVKVVNEDDLLAGEHAFDDVVLPLPGSRILYPVNDVADVYQDLAKKDGISLTKSVHNVKEFSITSMTGGYRKLFQRPVDYEWELLSYKDANLPLAETDLDMMSKSNSTNLWKEMHTEGNHFTDHSASLKVGKTNLENGCDEEERDEKLPHDEAIESSDSQLSQTALKIALTLPTSSYATMAIRELLKSSTSVAFQKTLNQ